MEPEKILIQTENGRAEVSYKPLDRRLHVFQEPSKVMCHCEGTSNDIQVCVGQIGELEQSKNGHDAVLARFRKACKYQATMRIDGFLDDADHRGPTVLNFGNGENAPSLTFRDVSLKDGFIQIQFEVPGEVHHTLSLVVNADHAGMKTSLSEAILQKLPLDLNPADYDLIKADLDLGNPGSKIYATIKNLCAPFATSVTF